MRKFYNLVSLLILIMTLSISSVKSQTFSSGTIYMCDTNVYTMFCPDNYYLNTYGMPTYFITYVTINITSNHPQSLKITLTSPAGTTLLLSAFNGNGGINYVNCRFGWSLMGVPSITTGNAPFTGIWLPEGAGGLSVFNNQNSFGTWKITVIDTACTQVSGGNGPLLTNGFFDGGAAGAGMGFGNNPCINVPSGTSFYICQGDSVNLMSFLYSQCFSCNSITVGSTSNPTAVSSAGIYGFSYTTSDGCSGSGVISISYNPSPNLGNDTIINNNCTGNFVNLDSIVNNSTIFKDWFLNGIPIPDSVVTKIDTSGIYQLIATNNFGCKDTIIFTVNSSPGISIGSDQSISICQGQTFDLNGLYNTSGLTPSWYQGGLLLAQTDSITASDLYTLVAIDTNGCTDTAEVNLSVLPSASIGNDQSISICQGNVTDLTTLINPQGGLLNWYDANGLIPPPISANLNGQYTAISSYLNGCSDTAIINLATTQNNILGANVSLSICDYDTINLTSQFNTTANTVEWYYNLSLVNNPTAVSNSGLYTIYATDTNGCVDSSYVTINVNSSPLLGVDQSVNGCFYGSVNLDSLYNLSGLSYSWSDGTNILTNSTSVYNNGIYILYVSDINGCLDTSQTTININQSPFLGVDQNISVCEGIETDLSTLYNTGLSTSTWYFLNSAITNISSVTNAGTYTIVETNSNGCTDTANVLISLFLKPNLGNDQILSICENEFVDLTSNFITTNYTTNWLFNGSSISTPANINFAGDYTLMVESTNGCRDTANVTVNHLQIPLLGIDQTLTMCADSSVNLLSIFNSNNNTNNWTLNNATITNTSNINIAGIYTLVATNINGCSDTANLNLNINSLPNPGPSQNLSICNGDVVNLNSSFNINYNLVNWTLNGQLINDVTSISDSGIYFLDVTNQDGCNAQTFLNLSILPKPEIGIDQTITKCSGYPLDLTTLLNLNALSTIWTNNNNPVFSPETIDESGNYNVIATNQFGCSDTATISLTVNLKPNLGPDQSYTLCPWRELDLDAIYDTIGLSTQYYFNGNLISNFNSVSDTGLYSIIVTDAKGCIDSALVQYSEIDCICSADFDYSTICLQDPIQLTLLADSVIVNSNWNFSNLPLPIPPSTEINPTINVKNSGELIVNLNVELTCGKFNISKIIPIEDCSGKCSFYIPNAFSPNNDGKNDQYQLISNCVPEIFKFSIRNRFGQEVFTSSNINDKWDGVYKRNEADDGIFVYFLEYKLPYQDNVKTSGYITLTR